MDRDDFIAHMKMHVMDIEEEFDNLDLTALRRELMRALNLVDKAIEEEIIP